MSAHRKAAERRKRKFASLTNNLRATRIPRAWLTETIKFMCVIHAGSYAMKNRRRILALHLEWRTAKRAEAQAAPTRWRPKKKLSQLTRYSQAQAWGKRLVVEAYHEALVNKLTPAHAERIANVMSVLIFGKSFSGRELRRVIGLVEERGGIVFAPIEAFATERSVPHLKARKTTLKEAA